MSFFYIRDNESGESYYLDAIYSVNLNKTGTPTSYVVEEGFNVSDHYVGDFDTISISGSISSAKFVIDGVLSTKLEDFITEIILLKDKGAPFTMRFSDYLNPYPTCLFSNLTIEQNKNTGDKSVDFSFSIVSIEEAQRAEELDAPEAIRANERYEKVLAAKRKAASSQKNASKQEEASQDPCSNDSDLDPTRVTDTLQNFSNRQQARLRAAKQNAAGCRKDTPEDSEVSEEVVTKIKEKTILTKRGLRPL